MKLESQVVSLELARKMRELGAPQESLFTWVEHYNYDAPSDPRGTVVWDVYPTSEMEEHKGRKQISAYTVAELGEMLPVGYWSGQDSKSVWVCKEVGVESPYEYEETEADARAKMWVYLKENNLI